MVYHGFKTSSTVGTAVPLAADRNMASFVTIFPRTGNKGEVRIGGNPLSSTNGALNGGTSAAIASGSGMPLSSGDAGVVWPMMAAVPIDLATIYMDVDNSGDGVQFIFGRP